MGTNDTIFKNQFDFKNNQSTQQAIIVLIDQITNAFDSSDMYKYFR